MFILLLVHMVESVVGPEIKIYSVFASPVSIDSAHTQSFHPISVRT